MGNANTVGVTERGIIGMEERSPIRLVVVDADPSVFETLSELLKEHGLACVLERSCASEDDEPLAVEIAPRPTPEQAEWRDRLEHREGVLKAARWELLQEIARRHQAEERVHQYLEELAHAERLASVGQMVSGVAHELNQPLAAISNFAQACRHTADGLASEAGDRIVEMIDAIAEQTDRACRILRHLRSFVRRSEGMREPTSINQLARDVAMLLEVEARQCGVRVVLQLDEDLPDVLVDQVQIQQVLMNLGRNAVEALQQQPDDSRVLTIHTSRARADGVHVSVEDSGPGLGEDLVERVFEPFFTTKEHGLGLGLSISRSIVESHEGRLYAQSRESGGAVFSFVLPPDGAGGKQ